MTTVKEHDGKYIVLDKGGMYNSIMTDGKWPITGAELHDVMLVNGQQFRHLVYPCSGVQMLTWFARVNVSNGIFHYFGKGPGTGLWDRERIELGEDGILKITHLWRAAFRKRYGWIWNYPGVEDYDECGNQVTGIWKYGYKDDDR